VAIRLKDRTGFIELIGIAAVVCLAMAGPATADETSARSCTGIADGAARLACYDAAFGRNQPQAPRAASTSSPPAAASVPPAAAAAAAAAKSPEQAFGDNGNLKSEVATKPNPPKRITATVVSAAPFGRGLYRLKLNNDQVWETKENDFALDFSAGDSVTISRMIAGNYLISRTGQGRTVAVKRTE
jgi:hypothetical protein